MNIIPIPHPFPVYHCHPPRTIMPPLLALLHLFNCMDEVSHYVASEPSSLLCNVSLSATNERHHSVSILFLLTDHWTWYPLVPSIHAVENHIILLLLRIASILLCIYTTTSGFTHLWLGILLFPYISYYFTMMNIGVQTSFLIIFILG